MKLIAVTAALITSFVMSNAQALPHSLPNGRLLTWDGQGLIPLDTEGPLTAGQQAGIRDLANYDLAKAMRGALLRMEKDPNDYVSAWTYAQAARLRKTETNALAELRNAAASLPGNLNILYSIGTIDTQIWVEYVGVTIGNRSKAEYIRAHEELCAIQDRIIAGLSPQSVGRGNYPIPLFVILMTNIDHGPRFVQIAETYSKAHSKYLFAKIRFAQCFFYGSLRTGSFEYGDADFSHCEALLNEIVRCNPSYGLPYYFLADSQVQQQKGYAGASPLFKKFLAMPDPPENYKAMAENYLKTGNARAIRTKFPP